jgi:DNA-binding MarR family transcriptional regulator
MTSNPQTGNAGIPSEMVSALDAALGNFVQQAVQGRAEVGAATSLLIGLPLSSAALTLMDRLNTKPMRPTELAAFVGIKPSSLTKQIQELEAKGLVERTADEQDGRAAIVQLTQFGLDSLAAAAELKQSILRQVVRGWSAEQVQQLIEMVDQLAEGVLSGWKDYWVWRSAHRQVPAERMAPMPNSTASRA